MSLCINPHCSNPQNSDTVQFCHSCGAELLIKLRYRVVRELGGGGFGKTYEVTDQGMPKVLKVLINNLPKAVELFQREAEVLSQLNFSGIPKVEPNSYFIFFPNNNQEPLHCLVMEKVEGMNLRAYLKQRGRPIDFETAKRWLTELLTILQPVHEAGILHRDIKPQNIMFKPDGKLALIDFGAVREGTGTEVATEAKLGGKTEVATHAAGTSIVSAGYTAPEQINGQAVRQSDFYALGRTFIFLLTGKEPSEISYDAYEDVLQWRKYVIDGEAKLSELIDKMTATLVRQRPKNAQEILQFLQVSQGKKQLDKKQENSGKTVDSSPFSKPLKQQSFRWKLLQTLDKVHPDTSGNFGYGVMSAVFSPDGKFLASAGADKKVKLWAIFNNKYVNGTYHNFSNLSIHKDVVRAVAFSPDGKILASSSNDKTIKLLWNWENPNLIWKEGKANQTLKSHSKAVTSLAFDDTGRRLVSGGDDRLIMVNLLEPDQLAIPIQLHSSYVQSVAFSPDGYFIASAGYDKKVYLIDFDLFLHSISDESAQEINFFAEYPGADAATSVAFSPNGKFLAIGDTQGGVTLFQLGFTEVKLESGGTRPVFANFAALEGVQVLDGHGFTVHNATQVTFSPDSSILASSGGDKTIKIWNVTNGKLLHTLTGHEAAVPALAFSPDGMHLVSGDAKGTIRIWERY